MEPSKQVHLGRRSRGSARRSRAPGGRGWDGSVQVEVASGACVVGGEGRENDN